MNKKLLINLIKSNLNEISGIVEDLDENKKIPPIFFDLTLSKIKNLYVQYKLMNETEESYNSVSYNDLASDISTVLEEDSNQQEQIAETPVETVEKTVEKTEEKNEEDYEKVARLREQDFLSIQLNFNPIKVISEEIVLNDKIWFTKSLFDGNLTLFNETLVKINDLEYLEKAIDYLDDHFEWDYDDATVKKFFQYVFMRYA